MSPANTLFKELGDKIEDTIEGHLFGKTCYKINGKAFICFFEDCIVFKLNPEQVEHALSLSDAQLFDPSKKGRPMKAWVQIPFIHQSQWPVFTKYALDYVANTK